MSFLFQDYFILFYFSFFVERDLYGVGCLNVKLFMHELQHDMQYYSNNYTNIYRSIAIAGLMDDVYVYIINFYYLYINTI